MGTGQQRKFVIGSDMRKLAEGVARYFSTSITLSISAFGKVTRIGNEERRKGIKMTELFDEKQNLLFGNWLTLEIQVKNGNNASTAHSCLCFRRLS